MRAIINPFLLCLGTQLLFLELLVSAVKKSTDYSPAIYYGDSEVNIGNPFSITCIISISDPIKWLKDGETITKHNLRHGKDVHAFFQSEHPIEAEVLSTEDFGINSKTFITPTSSSSSSIPSRKYDNEQLLDINFYSKIPQSSQKSLTTTTTTTTTAKQQFITTSLNTNINNKQDDLALVTPVVVNKNRKDSNDGGNNKPIIIFTIYKNITLNCELPNTAASDIEWEKNGTLVENVKSLKGRHKLSDNKFQIDKALLEDADLYSCVSKSNRVEIRKDFNVIAQVEVRVPSNLGVVEGESLRIQCTVIGTRPSITWEHGNLTLTQSSEKYELREDENKIANAILEIKNASLADRGEYKCIGKNEDADKAIGAKGAEDTSMVRVKGKLAALWPFLGICAEVFILCTIILIYEKKRNKTDLDESDTDPNTEQEKLKAQRN